MPKNKDQSIRTGNISGTGITVGHGAQTIVTITQESRKEILDLLSQLREEIQKSPISDGAKNVMLSKAVPEMEKAMQTDDPKSGLERGLERINDQLEGVGAAASNVSGIIETVKKIAQTTGIVIKTVAPFLAALL
jgi:hypothetical protein